jgi:hypothetical protein
MSDQEALSREIQRVTDWTFQERKTLADQLARADEQRGSAHGRFMLLAAGIVGVLVPLNADRLTPLGTERIQLAVMLFVATMAVSAAGVVAFRFLRKPVTREFSVYVDAMVKNRAEMILHLTGKGPAPGSEMETALAAFQKAADRREWWRTVEDLSFYGLFMGGLWNVAVAFLYGLKVN